MSSIAYVTDEKMLEYQRLCRHRTILFWRLSSKKNFSDFRKGDLLFFFSKPRYGRKKGFVGYAHFDSIKKLSIKQMWKNYGERTGYNSEQQLYEAIRKSARNQIPEKLSCLYLTGVVFFVSPVYPDEVDIEIPIHLESYCYLDRNDPEITVKILEKASKNGIDLWSADPDENPEDTFLSDMLNHQLAKIHHELGKETGSKNEKAQAHRIARTKTEDPAWSFIRGSKTDCIKIEDEKIHLAIPFVYSIKDKELRIREYIGRIMFYKLFMEQCEMKRKIHFEVLCEKECDQLKEMVKKINESI